MNILLEGIVGSTAYGLATANSDIDKLGIFAYHTQQLFTLRESKQSIVETNPDRTLHEAKKYCQLALQCNPSVLELLWLPDNLYNTRTIFGTDLIHIRTAFLSAHRVRDAYLGYARQQLVRMGNRREPKETTDIQVAARRAKHARHVARLLYQGNALYQTGELEVVLPDPQAIIDAGDLAAAGDFGPVNDMFRLAVWNMDKPSPLPDEPDQIIIESWLVGLRKAFL